MKHDERILSDLLIVMHFEASTSCQIHLMDCPSVSDPIAIVGHTPSSFVLWKLKA